MYNLRYIKEFKHEIMFFKHLFQLHITTKSKVRLDLFARFALYNELIAKCGILLYSLAVTSFFPYPIYMYFVKDERVPLLTLYIPFVNENTYGGYITLLIIQTFLIIITVVGMAASDILYAMMITNFPILARLIEDESNQLNEFLEEQEHSENGTKDQTWKYRFHNILVMHNEMTS